MSLSSICNVKCTSIDVNGDSTPCVFSLKYVTRIEANTIMKREQGPTCYVWTTNSHYPFEVVGNFDALLASLEKITSYGG